jgi:MFS family permease
MVYFLIAGVAGAVWTARLPAIKQGLGLDDAALGMALLTIAVGAVLAMQGVGQLIDRFGSAAVMLPAALVVSAGLVLPGYAGSYPVLLGALLVFGAGLGSIDVSMNAHAVLLQRRYQRQIMISFHAIYSVGGLLGSVAGALAARAGLPTGENFALVGAILLVLAVAAWPLLLAGSAPGGEAGPPARRGWSAAIVLLGTLGLCSMIGEGSMGDWSAVYLREVLHTSLSFAPIGFAVFSIAMGAFRFLGDRLVIALGPVWLVRACGLVAGVGLGIALLLNQPIAALVGFGLYGAGLSSIVPQVFTAAANRDPRRSGRDLARVSGLAYTGLLAGPVAIGFTAHALGLPFALGISALLALIIAVLSPAVRPTGGPDE